MGGQFRKFGSGDLCFRDVGVETAACCFTHERAASAFYLNPLLCSLGTNDVMALVFELTTNIVARVIGCEVRIKRWTTNVVVIAAAAAARRPIDS